MLTYEADTDWKRGIPFFFQNTNPILFVIFISYCFDLLYQRGYQRYDFLEIKWKKCRRMRQLRPETGESLVFFFKTLIKLYLFCLFLYFWLTVSEMSSTSILMDINVKLFDLWGSYGLKQVNPLQNLKIANQIVMNIRWCYNC